MIKNVIVLRFPAHGELGMCRTSLQETHRLQNVSVQTTVICNSQGAEVELNGMCDHMFLVLTDI